MDKASPSPPASPTTTGPPRRMRAFNVQKWLAENRHLLKPPVGNRLLHDGEFKVMLVAGPNSRTDYHVDPAEEWFYQLEGSMRLSVVHDGQFYDIPIDQGDSFCLPSGIPHSPQREPHSIGIVVERERLSHERDRLQWYCQADDCRQLLFSQSFYCADLVKDLPPIISDYYSDVRKRTCTKCRRVDIPPSKAQ